MSQAIKYDSVFDASVKNTFSYAMASDIEDVPDCAGIYAWYLPLLGDDSSDLIRFLTSLQNNSIKYSPASKIEADGQQRRVTVERKPANFDLQLEMIQRMASDMSSESVQKLSAFVMRMAFISEPIYVGMTTASNGLKSRLKQHLQSVKTFDTDNKWSGSFRTRVAYELKDKDSLKKCVICYMPLDDTLLGTDVTRILEHILIRTVRPAQSKKG
mgnify:CR=1 FL=1